MVARVAQIGATSGGAANAASFGLTWPAGLAVGDVAVCAWAMINTATPIIPAGWNVPGAFDGPGSCRSRLMWYPCDGTETGTLTLGNSNAIANRQSAVLIIYRGLDPDAPIDATPIYVGETAAQSTHTAPSVTTTGPDALVLTVVVERSSSGTNGWTAPPSYTKRADSGTAAFGTGGTVIAAADDGIMQRRAGVTVTPGSWTSTNVFASNNVTMLSLALAPLPHRGWGVPL
jgi:hypothetical protein